MICSSRIYGGDLFTGKLRFPEHLGLCNFHRSLNDSISLSHFFSITGTSLTKFIWFHLFILHKIMQNIVQYICSDTMRLEVAVAFIIVVVCEWIDYLQRLSDAVKRCGKTLFLTSSLKITQRVMTYAVCMLCNGRPRINAQRSWNLSLFLSDFDNDDK